VWVPGGGGLGGVGTNAVGGVVGCVEGFIVGLSAEGCLLADWGSQGPLISSYSRCPLMHRQAQSALFIERHAHTRFRTISVAERNVAAGESRRAMLCWPSP